MRIYNIKGENDRLIQPSSSIIFRSTLSALTEATVSLFSFQKRQNALISILIIQMFVPFLFSVNSHMSLLVYTRPEFRCQDSKTGQSVSSNLSAGPDHIISKVNTRYSKHKVFRVFRVFWLPQSLFCLRIFCPGVFAFINIIYIDESKLLKTVF